MDAGVTPCIFCFFLSIVGSKALHGLDWLIVTAFLSKDARLITDFTVHIAHLVIFWISVLFYPDCDEFIYPVCTKSSLLLPG
jgi:hypothetical protein